MKCKEHKNNYYNKEQKIPLEYYENILEKCFNLFSEMSNKNEERVIAVDGTYNNTNFNKSKKLVGAVTLNLKSFAFLRNNIKYGLLFGVADSTRHRRCPGCH